MPPALSRLTVVGLGLLGGSVARAARARGVAREIVAVGRTPATLARARAAGVVDTTTHDLATGVRGAELVVLCAPAGALPGLVREGLSLVVVEQDIGIALGVAHRVVCLQHGRVALAGAAGGLTREAISRAYFGI